MSLGITRFAYGLLLPAMRVDLGWSYTLAGAMKTANALGYFVGSLLTPWLLKRVGASTLLGGGAMLASLFMALSGFFTATEPLLLQRLLAGVASALVFIAGGLLAARLGAHVPQRPVARMALGLVAVGIGLCAGQRSAIVAGPGDGRCRRAEGAALPLAPVWLCAGRVYAVWHGLIGYMTFVVALLREQGRSALAVTVFYSLLGLAVMASSRIWAGLLDRHKNGHALAKLSALLGVATILPALTQSWPLVLASGLLFGTVSLSVVASTTALVRHNLPPSA